MSLNCLEGKASIEECHADLERRERCVTRCSRFESDEQQRVLCGETIDQNIFSKLHHPNPPRSTYHCEYRAEEKGERLLR